MLRYFCQTCSLKRVTVGCRRKDMPGPLKQAGEVPMRQSKQLENVCRYVIDKQDV